MTRRHAIVLATIALVVPALARAMGVAGAEAPAIEEMARHLGVNPAAYPPVTVQLVALVDVATAGLLVHPADLLAALALGACACILGWGGDVGARLGLALPGLVLALAEGPATMLLTLLMLIVATGLRRLRAEGDSIGLITASLGGSLLPFVHPAGAALALACLPIAVACLPAGLIAGGGMVNAALVGSFPLAAASIAYGTLATLYGGDPMAPFASLVGTAAGTDPGIGGGLLVGGVILFAPGSITMLLRGLARRNIDQIIPAALVFAPALGLALHEAGGGQASFAAALGPAATVAASLVTPRLSLTALTSLGLMLGAVQADALTEQSRPPPCPDSACLSR